MTRFGTTVRATPAPRTSESESGQGPWHLCIVHSPDDAKVGRAFALRAGQTWLGREPAPEPHAHIAITDDRISRVHAVMFCSGSEVRVEDRDSSNGLFVDGQRAGAAPLDAGSIVRVGDTVAVVQRGDLGPPEDEAGLAMVGRSPAMADMRTLIRQVAPSGLPVLIVGATGTGKELVARAVHAESRRQGPLVPVNCAALPATLVESILFGHRKGAFTGATADQPGAFVQADQGTLFLDEVGELTAEAQPKLLRILEDGDVTPVGASQSRHVDVRVVTATNVPLEKAVIDGRFRQDLHARLAGMRIDTPPLVARRQDIPLLFRHALPEPDRARPLSADFVQALLLYPWPENVRELRQLAARLLVLHPTTPRWDATMLDPSLRNPPAPVPADKPPGAGVKGPPSREDLVALLARFDGNVSQVADFVGRNRKQVYRWMDDFNIPRGAGRPEQG